MDVGIPKEIKKRENRVAITPVVVKKLVTSGHKVFIEKNAGAGSGFSDNDYEKAGAKIVSQKDVWQKTLILKIKEPLQEEYKYLKPGQILFTYLNLAGSPKELTEILLKKKVTAIALETVEKNGILNLLAPMSEVAGRMAIAIGAFYLQKHLGGKGILLDKIPNADQANVVVIGGGSAGLAAAEAGCARNANVYILEIRKDRRERAKKKFKSCKNVSVLEPKLNTIKKLLKTADLVIGAAIMPGARTSHIVTRKMVKTMEKGSVLIDISIDQGGCFETSECGCHDNPIRIIDGVIHYAVPNMPGAFPKTSTTALVNMTEPYVLKLAKQGVKALKNDKGFALGLMTYNGVLYSKPVGEYLKIKYEKIPKNL